MLNGKTAAALGTAVQLLTVECWDNDPCGAPSPRAEWARASVDDAFPINGGCFCRPIREGGCETPNALPRPFVRGGSHAQPLLEIPHESRYACESRVRSILLAPDFSDFRQNRKRGMGPQCCRTDRYVETHAFPCIAFKGTERYVVSRRQGLCAGYMLRLI